MTTLCCFYTSRKKKTSSAERAPVIQTDRDKNIKNLHVKLEHIQKSSETDELRPSSFSVPIPFPLAGSSRCMVKIVDHDDKPVLNDARDVDYEGGDEHDESLSMKKEHSYFDLQGLENEEERSGSVKNKVIRGSGKMHDKNNDTEEGKEMMRSGHISDPGINKTEVLACPRLKRSCSDLAMSNMAKEFARQLPYSDEELRLGVKDRDKMLVGGATSPISVMTRHSADKVMLKKHSSSQILPSGSRRLWWKLFLWSHRNLQRAETVNPVNPGLINQQGGYCSDTVEESGRAMDSCKFGSPQFSSMGETKCYNIDNLKHDDRFYTYGSCGTWPQNQWVAFSTESSSPLARVDEWVKEAAASAASRQPSVRVVTVDHSGDDIIFPPSPDQNGLTIDIGSSHLTRRSCTVTEEVSHANNVIQSLNGSSTVAHMAGIGLKVTPFMSRFSSLRSLNVSGNFIAHITPGSLPKGLHALNLSRNKITIIEGLRELTRLRVLDLSYNRISRIGQGLSNCTLIKELYLSGNKISSVEGLHRLLKLTVLDLSFNKITTKKAPGQLVANYNTLIALNLLGNPIQGSVSDDQICSLLPNLAFLNRQPINPQRARVVGTDAIAKAALGGSSSSTLRKVQRRSSVGTARKRSKTHSRHLKDKTR